MDTNDEQQIFEKIERYSLNKMDSLEKKDFEKEISKSSELKRMVEKFEMALKTIKEAAIEQQMIATLAKLDKNKKHPFIALIINKWKVMGTTAVAACLLFVFYCTFSEIRLPGSENDLTIVRDIDPTVLSPSQKNTYDHFFSGQAHIVEGEFNAATIEFEQVLKTPNLRQYFLEATQWHLAYSYMKSGDVVNAKKLYNELTEKENKVYPVGFLNKIKFRIQIFLANILT